MRMKISWLAMILSIIITPVIGVSQDLKENNERKFEKIEQIKNIGKLILSTRQPLNNEKLSELKKNIKDLKKALEEADQSILLPGFLLFFDHHKNIIKDMIKKIKEKRKDIEESIEKLQNSPPKDYHYYDMNHLILQRVLAKTEKIEADTENLLKENDIFNINGWLKKLIKLIDFQMIVDNNDNSEELMENPGFFSIVQHRKEESDRKKIKTNVFKKSSLKNNTPYTTENVPISQYLSESYPEIEFQTEKARKLREKAQELSTPVKIYEYVRNNFEYALYYGARSNSVNTFSGKRGNDIDLASVLIAMLRSQGIPSRYAVGTVQIPIEKVMNWLGVKNKELAKNIMTDQDIQNVQWDGSKKNLLFEHVWVEAFVSYENYRGAGMDAKVSCQNEPERCQWIGLDPSFKLKEYNENRIDIYDDIEFLYEDYYKAIKNKDSELKDKNPLEIYEESILKFLRERYPGKTLEDIVDSGKIIPEENMILPNSLPFSVQSETANYTSVKEHDQIHEDNRWESYVIVTFSKSPLFFSASPKIPLAEISTNRLTLSSRNNHMVLKAGNRVITEIKISESSDESLLSIGDKFVLSVIIDNKQASSIFQGPITYECIVGGYYLIAVGGEFSNWSRFQGSAADLVDEIKNYTISYSPENPDMPYVDSNSNNHWDDDEQSLLNHEEAMDSLTGGLLYTAQTLYYTQLREKCQRLGLLNHVILPIQYYIGVISTTYDVEYIDDTPFSIMPGGLLIDMKGIAYNGIWRINQAENYSNKTFELMGHIGSSLEHEVWQELTGYDAISTVRGIQKVLDNPEVILNHETDVQEYQRVETVYPSQPVVGANYQFVVRIIKKYDLSNERMYSSSYEIENNSSSQGGYVAPGENSLNPSTDTSGEFENEAFTNKNLIGNTNNDPVITPSTIDPVSTVTGNMYHDETDIMLKGRGLNIVFTRTYNSGPTQTYTATNNQPFNKGWTHSYNMRLVANDYGKNPNFDTKDDEISSITYVDERGGEYNFVMDNGNILPPTGLFAELDYNKQNSLHTITFSNGVIYTFEGILHKPFDSARLKSIKDPYGNQMNLTYSVDGMLENINDTLNIDGRTGLTLTYENHRLKTLSDWTGRTWTFGYDLKNLLSSMTNPLTQTTQYIYNSKTNLLDKIIKPEDRNGKKVTTTFRYYQNGKAFDYTDALGNKESLSYDLFRKRTRVTDPAGNIREYFYDSNGSLIKLFEPDNGILFFDNNDDGLRCKKINPLGYETQYSYSKDHTICTESDTQGNVTLEIDPAGNQIEYSYGIYSQIENVTDKNVNKRQLNYYESQEEGGVIGKLKNIQVQMSGQWVTLQYFKYYTDGNLLEKIEYINPEMTRTRTTEYIYYPNSLNVKQMIVKGSDELSITYSYTYDELNRKQTETLYREKSVTDPTMITLTTRYEYDLLDRVTNITDPLGNIVSIKYDKNGKLFQKSVKYKKPDNAYENERIIFTRDYDAADRLVEETDSYSNTTSYQYDASGNMRLMTDANNHQTHFEYDAKGRQTAIVDANGNRTETRYDLAGNVTHVIDARENIISYTYNNLGQKIAEETPMGHITKYDYYPNGNLKSITDANALEELQEKNMKGVTVYYEYDELDRLIYILDAKNGETHINYDLLSENNITRITDAKGRVTEFVYNDLGQLKTIIKPNLEDNDPYLNELESVDIELLAQSANRNRPINYTYDTAGNVLSKTDHKNQQTHYFYDELNRLRRIEYLNDNTSETFDYDHFGDLILVSNENVTYTYTYDQMHRMTSKKDSRFGKSLEWKYDAVGNIDYKINYQGEVTDYTYDSTNRLVNLRNRAYLQVNYHYDPAGRLLDRILSNGAKTSYEYDDNNRLKKLSNTSISGTVSVNNYFYDNVGNITSIKDENDNLIATFDYDPLYQLLSADYEKQDHDRTYSYDNVGNRLTETRGNDTILSYQYNARNLLRSVQSNKNERRVYFYDDNGNRCAMFTLNGSEKGHSLYNYDAKNRMISAEGIFFKYDVNDYRIRKVKPDNTIHYLLEGEHLEAMYDQGGKIIAKFLRGVIIDEVVSGYFYDEIGKKTNYTFHHDHQRSVVALTDRRGNIVENTMYGPFGEEYESSGGTENILKYTGREIDKETGLYYHRKRYRDLDIGTFISEDPIGFEGGINLYAYAGNNPINFTDPMGLEPPENVPPNIDYLKNIDEAEYIGHLMKNSSTTLTGSLKFYNAVRTGGIWDYKKGGRIEYEPFGNYHFGVVSAAADIPEFVGKLGAGLYQALTDYKIGSKDLEGIDGVIEGLKNIQWHNWKDYFDDPRDQRWIEEGYNDFREDFFNTSNQLNQNISNASGAFVLYPNKPNTNMMRAVYAK